MIISVSRRTDIPAYYSEWFLNRVGEGFCDVANPFNPKQISRISLLPEDVTAIVFWSRRPGPLIKKLAVLDEREFKYYFLLTLNGYSKEYEPRAPSTASVVECFRRLADRIGPGRIVWRYDPILIDDNLDYEFHLKNFSGLCKALNKSTGQVIISCVSEYRNSERRLRQEGIRIDYRFKESPDFGKLLREMALIAAGYEMTLSVCCADMDFSPEGAGPARCVDDRILEKEFGLRVPYKKDKGQRKFCNCCVSRDVGAYNTCIAGCVYCYAVHSGDAALKNYRRHNPRNTSMLF